MDAGVAVGSGGNGVFVGSAGAGVFVGSGGGGAVVGDVAGAGCVPAGKRTVAPTTSPLALIPGFAARRSSRLTLKRVAMPANVSPD